MRGVRLHSQRVRGITRAALAASALMAGCADRDEPPRATRIDSVASPVVIPPEFGGNAPSYVTIDVTRGGRISGTVELGDDIPADTIVRPGSDTDVCGTAFVDSTVHHTGNALGDAVVWLADARSGKPLPLSRRFQLEHSRCRLAPRVQAVIAGGTLNFLSSDRALHQTRFIRAAGAATISVIDQYDDGQLVPLEDVLGHPGRIEVRCDRHPWTRAWLVAFDHPYYAVTDPRGAFTIDSIPVGRYRLMAWHERLGVIERQVVVRAESTTTVGMRYE
jgi:hypothetical protein